MRHSLLILSFLLTFISQALADNSLCFKVIQGGVEVNVICAGQPVRFVNCSDPTPSDATVLFFPGKKEEIKDENKIAENEPYHFPGVGKYTITLLLNRSGGAEYLERVLEVKATPDPTFTAIACANRKVSINLTDQQYDTYTINYGNGQQETVAKGTDNISHTYTTDGPYQITVTGKYEESICASQPIMVRVNQPAPYTPPTISNLQVLQQNATDGIVNFTLTNLLPGYNYTLLKRAESENNFSTITTLTPAQTTYRLQNTNTNSKTEYKIEVTDACGIALTGSNTISNIVISTTAENERNVVQWQSISSFQSTRIFRNGELLPLTNPASPYVDTDVSCGVEYCYEVKGATADGAVSASVIQCVTSYSITKPPTGTLLATYNLNNQIELTFTAPVGQNVTEVNIEHSIKGTPYTRLATAYQQPYLVELTEPVPVCYRANYKNGCALSEMSREACPMLLSGQQVNGTVTLNWSAYIGFSEGIAGYTLEVLDENNQVVNSYPSSGTNFTHKDNSNDAQLLRYRVKATSNNGTVTYSNLIVVEQEVQIYIPSGFTPNGDGLNDLFEVRGRFIKDFSIRIYNGMGQVVYRSDSREESWDGTYKGTQLPAGAYAYEVIVTSTNNKKRHLTGTVTLLR